MYKKALKVLKSGGIITFPCDTVMGIGCSMSNRKAIKRLYNIKNRSFSQPTAVLVENQQMAGTLIGVKIDKCLNSIMEKYWSGALTIVVKASEIVPQEIMGQTDKVGIRVPNSPQLQQMIGKLGSPLVATSANFFGEETPIRYSQIDKEFLKLVDYSIREDSTGISASTVIKYKGNGNLEYLRKGLIEV